MEKTATGPTSKSRDEHTLQKAGSRQFDGAIRSLPGFPSERKGHSLPTRHPQSMTTELYRCLNRIRAALLWKCVRSQTCGSPPEAIWERLRLPVLQSSEAGKCTTGRRDSTPGIDIPCEESTGHSLPILKTPEILPSIPRRRCAFHRHLRRYHRFLCEKNQSSGLWSKQLNRHQIRFLPC